MFRFRPQAVPAALTACLGMMGVSLFVFADDLSAAESRQSVYTSIRNPECRFERSTGPGSEEAQTKRCLGLAKVRVIVDAGGTSVSLGFEWLAARPRIEARAIVVGWSLGERLEWRGAARAPFNPDSAIVRVLFNREGSLKVGHQVLAVLSVSPGNACLRGLVDLTANKDAYELARRIGDDTSGFTCGTDSPRVEGPPTEWTSLVIERAGGRSR